MPRSEPGAGLAPGHSGEAHFDPAVAAAETDEVAGGVAARALTRDPADVGARLRAQELGSEQTHALPGVTGPVPASAAVPADAPLPDEPAQRLGTRTARGAVVTLAGQLTQILLQMTAVVVLARLLSPKDYGLYATVLVVAGIGEIFRDFGLSSAAVQAKTLSRAQRDNLFWINTGIGVLLTGVVFAGAPLIAHLYGSPELTDLLRLLSVIFLVNGMTTQYRASANRRMRFGLLAAADLSAQVMNVGTAVLLAVLGFKYWALVLSQIAMVVTVFTVIFCAERWLPGRPRRGVPMASFLRYGRNFVGTQLVGYTSSNIDNVVIGLRFGPSPLGLYNRAWQLLMNPLNQLRSPATTVALPVLARLRDDPERANDYIRRAQLAIGYTVVLGLAFAASAATPLVNLFLGARWTAVPPVFALLAVSASFQMLSFVGYWVYLSRGLTADLFRYTFVSLAIRASCILIGSQWGLVGIAAGCAVAPAISWPISLWWLNSRTDIPVRALYSGAGRILGVCTLSGTASLLVVRALAGRADIVAILAGLVTTVAVAALLAVAFGRIRSDLGDLKIFFTRLRSA